MPTKRNGEHGSKFTKKHIKSIILIVFGTSPKKGNGKKTEWIDELIHLDNNGGLRNIDSQILFLDEECDGMNENEQVVDCNNV